ncbi:hypothetical protein NPIL_116991 [Nephila pilipes]|uniref:Uncharacterized protein n=1 Tax=Nephila pilipes TaxID=299642 RepID=A0A8X6MKT0_NEPPI|nr:hypothetical protein NPIL_116991 [Nephila pilipes]
MRNSPSPLENYVRLSRKKRKEKKKKVYGSCGSKGGDEKKRAGTCFNSFGELILVSTEEPKSSFRMGDGEMPGSRSKFS